MTKPPRLDAPSADLRALDRGPLITKAIGVEPRVCPTAAQERAALETKWAKDKDAAEKLSKSAQPVPADLSKAVKTMADLANIALKAAERSEAAARRIEAALVEKAAPSIKSALAKIDQAGLFKKGR